MGVDATIYWGDAVVVNPYYLNEEQKKYIDDFLSDKDVPDTVLCYGLMDAPSVQLLTFWVTPPQQIFPGDDRRPLVINNNNQLKLMKPTPDGPDINTDKLWNPSYESFDMMTLTYEKKEYIDFCLNKVIDNLKQYKISELEPLIKNKSYTFVGKWLKFFHH